MKTQDTRQLDYDSIYQRCMLISYDLIYATMLTAHPTWSLQKEKCKLCKHFAEDYISYTQELEIYTHDLESMTDSQIEENYYTSREAVEGIREYTNKIVKYSQELIQEE